MQYSTGYESVSLDTRVVGGPDARAPVWVIRSLALVVLHEVGVAPELQAGPRVLVRYPAQTTATEEALTLNMSPSQYVYQYV